MLGWLENVSHDTINRYLTKENFTSESLWQNVKKDIQISENSAIIFDDTLLDKRFGEKIELVRRQYKELNFPSIKMELVWLF